MTGRRTTGWRVEQMTAPAASLLAPWPPSAGQEEAIVRIGRVQGRAALVLGSTQDETRIDPDGAGRAGVDILRRSTGGGAVLVAPGAQVWLDIWLPKNHHLWNDDVVVAASWVGDAWVEALAGLGTASLGVHRGPLIRTAWSDRLCFAGFGPGEVSVVDDLHPDGTGAKVMGLAQRRSRTGARFHTTALLSWDPEPLLALFKADADDEHPDTSPGPAPSMVLKSAAVGLLSVVSGVTSESTAGDVMAAVEQAVITALP